MIVIMWDTVIRELASAKMDLLDLLVNSLHVQTPVRTMDSALRVFVTVSPAMMA